MFRLSKFIRSWAKLHIWQAQLLILICYTLLYVLLRICGQILQTISIAFPIWVVYTCFLAGIIINIIHTLLHKRVFIKNWFAVSRSLSMAIHFLSFIGLLAIMSLPVGTFPAYQTKSHAAFPIHNKTANYESTKVVTSPVVPIEKSPGTQVLLIILVVNFALCLEYFIAMLACSLACDDYGLLALGVAALGTGGVVLLAVHLIRQIVGVVKRKPVRYSA